MTVDLGDRTTYIGASDVGAILGLSPYKTPLQVFLEKTGEIPAADLSENEDVQRGVRLEPIIAREYCALRDDFALQYPAPEFTHPDLPFVRVHPDAIGNGFLAEFKAPRTRWEGVPEHYRAQCFAQLACVPEAEYCDLVPSFAGNAVRAADIIRIERDASVIAYMLEQLAAFWERVQKGVPPDPQGLADVNLRWRVSRPASTITADAAILKVEADMRQIRSEIERLEKAHDDAEEVIKTFMGENEVLLDPHGKPLRTWRTQTSQRCDTKALKAAHPEIYAQFTGSSQTRVFRTSKGA